MNIDKAIEHYLELAEQYRCETNDCIEVHDMENAEKCTDKADEYEQIVKWLKENKELKRLLAIAVEDFALYGNMKDMSVEQRIQSPDWLRYKRVFDILDHTWRYADSALKLIGDDINE